MIKSPNVRIAILGSNGHIGKNLTWYFSADKNHELILFSRNPVKTRKTIKNFPYENFIPVCEYSDFGGDKYDVIINCIGVSDPKQIHEKPSLLLNVTEYYDNLIIGYLQKNPTTLYVNMSSGAVYGEKLPGNDLTGSKLNITDPNPNLVYSVSKIYSEIKHRLLKNFNIVDIRIFGFFSRFIDVKSKFFMSDVVSSIKFNKTLETNNVNFIRDYVHPQDLCLLIKKCMKKRRLNNSFDIYSKKPVSKMYILDALSQKYGLKYEITKNNKFYSPTGIKKNYYSLSKKAASIGYGPHYSSLETIMNEIKFILD